MVNGVDTAIGAMELKLFSHAYESETDNNRLARLEKFVYGASSADGSLNDRLARLRACVALKSNLITAVNPAPKSVATSTGLSSTLANVSNYPRVTQLELRLLNTSYFGEPIAKRLGRLEIKEFGAASTSNDLAARMDALSAITTSNADKTRVNELASAQSPEVVINNYREHVNSLFQYVAKVPQREQPTTVVDQIEYLESAAFGKTHPNKPLQKRVGALEERYYGASKVDGNNLTYRVAQLLSLVNNGSPKAELAHS